MPGLEEPTQIAGDTVLCEANSQHPLGQVLPLGSYSYSHSKLEHVASIGRYCSIGRNISVMGESHPTDWLSSSPVFYRKRRARIWGSMRLDFPDYQTMGEKVTIENDVWIGDDVALAHGITLGTGCVIATRAVVTKDVPPFAIVGGTPARVIRYRFNATNRKRLLASKWWSWPVQVWDEINTNDISAVLDHVDMLQETVAPLPVERMTLKSMIKTTAPKFLEGRVSRL